MSACFLVHCPFKHADRRHSVSAGGCKHRANQLFFLFFHVALKHAGLLLRSSVQKQKLLEKGAGWRIGLALVPHLVLLCPGLVLQLLLYSGFFFYFCFSREFFLFSISFSFLPSLEFLPRGTLHCINQGSSAPHGGYSISTHHLTGCKGGGGVNGSGFLNSAHWNFKLIHCVSFAAVDEFRFVSGWS